MRYGPRARRVASGGRASGVWLLLYCDGPEGRPLRESKRMVAVPHSMTRETARHPSASPSRTDYAT